MIIRILFLTIFSFLITSCSLHPEITYKSKTRDFTYSTSITKSIDEKCFFNVISKQTAPSLNKVCQKQVFYPIDPSQSQLIAVLEINEQGRFINQEHVKAVLNEVKKAKNPVISVFVHGWKHNGKIDDPNLIDFKNMLINLNSIKKLNARNRKNFGIYIAWRGKTSNIPIVKELSFWNRKNISKNIGSGDLGGFILDLERTLILKKNEQTNLILAGHSFGASVLYNAVGPILLTRFEDSITKQKLNPDSKIPLVGIGDTILLINPAIEAKQFLPLREAIWRKASTSESLESPEIFNHNLYPFFVVVSSNADWAVNSLFPLGRYASTFLINKYDKTKIINGNSSMCLDDDCFKNEPNIDFCNNEGFCNIPEIKLNTLSIGNFPWYYTHWLRIAGKDKSQSGTSQYKDMNVCQISDNDWLEQVYVHKNNWDALLIDSPNNYVMLSTFNHYLTKDIRKKHKLDPNLYPLSKHKASSWYKNPYWFVYADKDIIPGHNSIWNKKLGCFLMNIIKIQ